MEEQGFQLQPAAQAAERGRKPWHAPKVIVAETGGTENGGDNVKTDIDADSAS
jgi:hypothetical protein